MCWRSSSPSALRARAARQLLFRRTPVAFWPPDGPQGIEQPGQLRPTRCAQTSAERELSTYRNDAQRLKEGAEQRDRLDNTHVIKEKGPSREIDLTTPT